MKKKILVANGCSMTYGLELINEQTATKEDHIFREKTAWPGQLKELLGFDKVYNLAVNSGSNDRVLRTTLYEVSKLIQESNVEIFVVIGWSGAARREFFIDNEWLQVVPYHEQSNKKLDKLNHIYREVAWNELECSVRFFTEVVALQGFLEVNSIPYLFFDAISPAKELIITGGNMVEPYLNQINELRYMNLQNINGCMADILRKEVPVWNGRHPSPDGHKYWANLLFDYIKRNKLLEKSFVKKTLQETGFQTERKLCDIDFIYT